ncbi:MAG: histidine phosphatase family protein, partial [Planctomycetota bacterium]
DAEVDSCIGDAGWWNGRPRETDDECRTRAAAVKMRLENTFGTRQENVVIMLHAEFKRFLLDEILSPGIDAFRLGSLRNTSVSKLDFTDQGWQLDWLNSVSHLPAGLVTRGKG